jgi:hypothetical protein
MAGRIAVGEHLEPGCFIGEPPGLGGFAQRGFGRGGFLPIFPFSSLKAWREDPQGDAGLHNVALLIRSMNGQEKGPRDHRPNRRDRAGGSYVAHTGRQYGVMLAIAGS